MEKDKKEKLKQAATLAGAAVLGGSTAEAAILLNSSADEIQEPDPVPAPPAPNPDIPEPVSPGPTPVTPTPEPVNPGEPQPQIDVQDPGLLEPIEPVGPVEPVDPNDIPYCEYGPPPVNVYDDPILTQEEMYAGPDVMYAGPYAMGDTDVLDGIDDCVDPIDLSIVD